MRSIRNRLGVHTHPARPQPGQWPGLDPHAGPVPFPPGQLLPGAVGPAPVAARGGQDPNLPAGAARWIAVAGIGNEVGTTTVAALLSAAYAAHRRYRIVVVDADPAGGALRTRLATRGAATVAEVASVATELTTFTRLAPYLDQTAEGAWGLTGAGTAAPDVAQTRDALNALSGFFAVGVVDSGAAGTPNADAMLAAAHSRLLVAPVTAEGVLAAASALDWLAAQQDTGLRSHCTVALVSTTRNPNTDVGWAARLLTGRGGRVFPVPYDVALAARRISASSVSDGVSAAVRRLSTELLSRAAGPIRNG